MNPNTNSENTENSSENSNNPISGNKSEQQNITYPTDIQGLFDRLGIK